MAQYEHIDPPFAQAKQHEPSKIALLCGACHDKVTRGLWSKQKIAQARIKPITFNHGEARDAFDINGPLTLHLGSSSYEDIKCIVRTGSGNTWLGVAPADVEGGPYRLSAQFFNDQGQPVLTIEENDWFCPTTAWDVEVEGNFVTVRNGHREIALQLQALPPNGLRLHRLNMTHRDFSVTISADGIMKIKQDDSVIECDACSVDRSDTIFFFENM